MKFAWSLATAILWTVLAIVIVWLYVSGCPYKWAVIAPVCAVATAIFWWVELGIKLKRR